MSFTAQYCYPIENLHEQFRLLLMVSLHNLSPGYLYRIRITLKLDTNIFLPVEGNKTMEHVNVVFEE